MTLGGAAPGAHEASTRAAYDAVAEEYARVLPGLDAETALDVAVLDDFAARVRGGTPGPVLDAGCGTGRITAHLSALGLDISGVDLSPGAVEVARREHAHLRFEVGSLAALDLPDGHLAGVLAWYSLIHTPPEELAGAVAELGRVLRPGGWLLTAFQAGTGEPVQRESAYGHPVALTSYRMDPDVVAGLLAGVGLEVRVRLVREAEGGHESTPQALFLGFRPIG